MIQYLVGDATYPTTVEGREAVICHIVNDVSCWGKGFVLAISKRWPQCEKAYRNRIQDLGTLEVIKVEESISVFNMCAQRGLYGHNGIPPIRYDALSKCLNALNKHRNPTSCTVHMPRIGCGLGGGDWTIIERLIQLYLAKFDVYIYDLPQETVTVPDRGFV